jgi:LacI family transcriptional regulator
MSIPRKQVRLKDVAEVAGTSTKTASRVINGDARVASATRARVEAAVQDLGYQVDLLARSLRRGVDDTVGVVVPTIGDPFFASALEQVERFSTERDINVLVASNSNDPAVEREIVEGLLARRVGGLLITPNFADYSFLANSSTPYVFMDRHPRGLTTGAVRVDDRGQSELIVNHLAAHGHQRIALVSDDVSIPTSNLRRMGYLAAMAALELPIDPDLQALGCSDFALAEEATHRLLDLPNPPTAIFSSRSETSIGVVRALHVRNRTDIAFVSFGDFSLADILVPGVTVLDHDPAALARLSMDLLADRMDGKVDDGVDHLIPMRLIPRGSGEIPLAQSTHVRSDQLRSAR